MKTTMRSPQAAIARIACIAAVLSLAACNRPAPGVAAQEPADDTACALDGMILKDYPGPKAQIHYAEGKPDFFCDLVELFMIMLAPEQKRHVAGLFVQDMGKADWNRPVDHWIDARKAVYVVGSKKRGSMGPTFGAFSNAQDAAAFVQKEGGKIVSFDQVTLEMVNAAHGNKK